MNLLNVSHQCLLTDVPALHFPAGPTTVQSDAMFVCVR